MGQTLSATKSILETCSDKNFDINNTQCAVKFDPSGTNVTKFGAIGLHGFQGDPDIAGQGVRITPCHFHSWSIL